LSSTDALFTRFEELFKKFLNRLLIVGFASQVSVDLEPTKRDLLRQFFDLSWDKKELPSKKLLMEVVRFIGPPPIRGFEEVEDHVAESFDLALEKLRFEEPKQEEEETVSLPHPQQKPKPGRKGDPKIQKRGEIVRKHIYTKKDFFDKKKKQVLLREFEENEIPFPRNQDGLLKYLGMTWQEIMSQSAKWEKVVDSVLERDRFPRKRKTATE